MDPKRLSKQATPHAVRLEKIFPEFAVRGEPDITTWLRMEWPRGGLIHVDFDGYGVKGKYAFSGIWPRGANNAYYSPKDPPVISVSQSRTDEQIRKDFDRRFWPRFQKCWEESTDRRNRDLAFEVDRCTAAAAIRGVLGLKANKEQPDSVYCTDHGLRELRVNAVDSVRMLFDGLPLAVTLEILELVKVRIPKKD